MKKFTVLLTVLFCVLAISAQNKYVKKVKKKTIFAVVNDGKQIEPVAFIENGKLEPIVGDDADLVKNPEFVEAYYKPKTKYNLIFGGENAGTVSVTKDLAKTDCAANQAEISILSKTVKPKGFVMALATNAAAKKSVKGTRKLPTPEERLEIEKLVMAEMLTKNIPIKKINELRYHNLTKVDVDNDGNPEFVGTFWYNTGDKIRSLMFFIADKNKDGTISIPFSKFNEVKEEDVMNNDIKTVDSGTLHELLIDIFDVDGDGTGEIFTMINNFEGSNFNAYKKVDGKWGQVLDTYNYHCGF